MIFIRVRNRVLETRFPCGRHVENMPHWTISDHGNQVSKSWNGFGVDPLLNFERKFEVDAAPTSYFGSNFLLKIPIDSRLVFFERKFNYLQLFQK